MLVVFLGPDGSGKSTVIRQIATELAPAFRQTEVLHLRPRLGLRSGGGNPVTDPHSRAPRGRVASTLKVLYFVFDYLVGYLLRIRPMLVASTLVLFDRYYHDLLVDPRRYRYGGSMWLARAVARIIPRPDLWVLLDAPPEVLRSRKQEVSLGELRRQRAAYRELAGGLGGLSNSIVVDADRDLEDVVSEVATQVLAVRSGRFARRMGR